MGFSEINEIRISIKSYNSLSLNILYHKIQGVLSRGPKYRKPVALPTKIRKYCVLTSPHVNKNAREQFEIRTYNYILYISSPTKIVLENLRNLIVSPGVYVDIKVF